VCVCACVCVCVFAQVHADTQVRTATVDLAAIASAEEAVRSLAKQRLRSHGHAPRKLDGGRGATALAAWQEAFGELDGGAAFALGLPLSTQAMREVVMDAKASSRGSSARGPLQPRAMFLRGSRSKERWANVGQPRPLSLRSR